MSDRLSVRTVRDDAGRVGLFTVDDLENPVMADSVAAAALAGVPLHRVRHWSSDGKVAAVGSAAGRNLYRMSDVWEAEKTTRQAKKTRGCLTNSP